MTKYFLIFSLVLHLQALSQTIAFDSFNFNQIIVDGKGKTKQIAYKSNSTNLVRWDSYKVGNWQYFNEYGELVKTEKYKFNKRTKKSELNGEQYYFNAENGDTLLVSMFSGGGLRKQNGKPYNVIIDGQDIITLSDKFGKTEIRKIKRVEPLVTETIKTSPRRNEDNPIRAKHLALEEQIGDQKLLIEPAFSHSHPYNLVQNSDMEVSKHSKTVISFTNEVHHWKAASPTPDYFQSSSVAKSGTGFLGFRVFSFVNDIEYLQNELYEPLEKDSFYCFSAQLRLSPESHFATNAFGFLLSKDEVYIHTGRRLTLAPSKALSSQLLIYKSQWMNVQSPIKARGNEKYLVVGSFKDHRELSLVETDGLAYECYFFLDNVSLVKISDTNVCKSNFSLESGLLNSEMDTTDKIIESVDFGNVQVGDKIILENIYFENDRAELLPASIATLNALLDLLYEKPNLQIEISGHTSDVGGYEHNVQLSYNRAKAVQSFLLTSGVLETRLRIKGFGPDKPISSNQNEEGQKRNRRVEFEVLSL